MKNIFQFVSSVVLLLTISSCKKAAELPSYTAGVKPTLAASATIISPAFADANKPVLTLSWTDAQHATSQSNVKYTVEIDSAGKNFTSPLVRTVTGVKSTTFLASELNTYLINRGYAFNSTVSLDVRVTSSYANNNESLSSDIIRIKYTIYKTPPKINPPTNLYLVGDVNGWNNSASLDKKFYFYKTGETTFEGVFNFTSGGNYKLIQTLGDWGSQFHMLSGGTAFAGQFEQKDADPAFPIPTPAGSYRIVVDFQTGTYTATPTAAVRVNPPANLYLVGDLNGWNNSASLDSKYKFTKVNDFVYTLNVDFTSGGAYKLIQTLGDWGSQFHMIAGGTAFAGEFEQRDADPAFPNPTPAGNYKITVNFATMTYTAVRN